MTGITKNFTVDYRNEELKNVFLKISSETYLGESQSSSYKQEYNPKLNSAEVLCFAADKLEDADVDVISNYAKSGKRIYVLLGDDKANRSAIEKLRGRCHVRTGIPQSGALVLANMHTVDGFAWVFPENRISDGKIAVQAESSKEWLYQTFCYLFYKKAEYSYITDSHTTESGVKVSEEKKPIYDIPVDEPFAKPGKLLPSLKDEIKNDSEITSDVENTDWLKSVLPIGKCSRISFVLPENSRNEVDISEFCNKAEKIGLCDYNSLSWQNTVKRDGGDAFYVPSSPSDKEVNWTCREAEQERNVCSWELVNKSLNDFEADAEIQYADDVGSVVQIKDKCEMSLEDIYTESFEDYFKSPEKLCADMTGFKKNNPVMEITYTVTIHPPYLPKDAKKHNLGWDGVQDKWTKELEALGKKVNEYSESYKNKFSTKLCNLLLGSAQKSDEIIARINDLKRKVDYTRPTSPGERSQIEEEFNSLSSDVARIINNKESAEHHIHELEEWDMKHSHEEKDIKLLEEKKKDYENKISNLISEIDKENNEEKPDGKKLKDLKEKQKKLEKDLERCNKDCENSIKRLNDLDKEKPKYNSGLDEGDMSSLDKALKIGSKNRNKLTLDYPKTELPRSGEIYKQDKQLYLVIKSPDKDAYNKAKSDAERLNAKICVKEE